MRIIFSLVVGKAKEKRKEEKGRWGSTVAGEANE